MDLRNKFVRDISPPEILNVIAQRAVEDDYLEFKAELLHPGKSPKAVEDAKEDLLADLVAFANAAGGLILIGVAEDAGRALSLAPMTVDEAEKLANTIRDMASAHIKPGILQLEVVPFQMDEPKDEWIVVVRVPEGPDKPYMSVFREQTRFAIRVGNRKRAMAYDEIQQGFVANPQQARMAQILGEIESIKSLLSDLGKRLEE